MLKEPSSDLSSTTGLLGAAGLTLAWMSVASGGLAPGLLAAFVLLVAAGGPMLWLERRRACPAVAPSDTGVPPTSNGWRLAGSCVLAAPVFGVHWLWMAQIGAGPAGLFLAIVTVATLLWDGRPGAGWRSDPDRDGPARVGRALSRAAGAMQDGFAEAVRAWTLRAFFLPIYGFMLVRLTTLTPQLGQIGADGGSATLVRSAHHLLYSLDLTFAALGYLVTAGAARGGDVRSTQTSPLGWAACLVCYPPLISLWPAAWFFTFDEIGWPATALVDPTGWTGVWTVGMLALLALYAWSTVAFGLRFSNLSDRGLVSHGPYRWMKHPAYFVHVANVWMLYLAFAPSLPGERQVGGALFGLFLTAAYRLRAVTEERHLSRNPRYAAYCRWIGRHGALARGRRRLVRMVGRAAAVPAHLDAPFGSRRTSVTASDAPRS